MDLEKIVREEVKELLKEKLFNKEEKVEEIKEEAPAVNKLDSTTEATQPTNTMI